MSTGQRLLLGDVPKGIGADGESTSERSGRSTLNREEETIQYVERVAADLICRSGCPVDFRICRRPSNACWLNPIGRGQRALPVASDVSHHCDW